MRPLTCIGDKINVCRICSGKSKGKKQLEDIGVDARIILKVILKK